MIKKANQTNQQEQISEVFTGWMMVAPGPNGSFPSSTDDATKPTSIIPFSNPHMRTTGFQGTRMYMATRREEEANPLH